MSSFEIVGGTIEILGRLHSETHYTSHGSRSRGGDITVNTTSETFYSVSAIKIGNRLLRDVRVSVEFFDLVDIGDHCVLVVKNGDQVWYLRNDTKNIKTEFFSAFERYRITYILLGTLLPLLIVPLFFFSIGLHNSLLIASCAVYIVICAYAGLAIADTSAKFSSAVNEADLVSLGAERKKTLELSDRDNKQRSTEELISLQKKETLEVDEKSPPQQAYANVSRVASSSKATYFHNSTTSDLAASASASAVSAGAESSSVDVAPDQQKTKAATMAVVGVAVALVIGMAIGGDWGGIVTFSKSLYAERGNSTLLTQAEKIEREKVFYVTGLNPNEDNWLALRSGTDKDAVRLRKLPPNTLLYSTGETRNQWLRVRTTDGVSGWVAKKYTACCVD